MEGKEEEEEEEAKRKRRRRKTPAMRYESVWSLLNFFHSKMERERNRGLDLLRVNPISPSGDLEHCSGQTREPQRKNCFLKED